MDRYSRGKIYKIVCNATGKQYIGSTTEPTLSKRLAKHRLNFKTWKNGHGNFTTSYLILEEENYEIILIELYPCSSRDELMMRERFWQDNIECINKVKSYTSKEEKKIYKKKWADDNKEQIAEKRKKWVDDNKEQILNKDRIRWENRKEKYNLQRREKICCLNCKKEINKGNLSRHQQKCKTDRETLPS
jgi:hypothetical protein